jgi:rhodanese-related sulfurtransferase
MFNDIFSALRGPRVRVPNIGSDEFARLMREEPNAVVLDVRTSGEFAAGHIPNAVNIDMMDPDFDRRVDALDRTAPVLLYCRSGNRSYHAGNRMLAMGFAHVYNLARGVIGWHEPLTRQAQ